MMENKEMKIAWLVLLISAGTDFVITAGAALSTAMVAHGGSTEIPSLAVCLLASLAGLTAFARTIGQGLKSDTQTSTALRGNLIGEKPNGV